MHFAPSTETPEVLSTRSIIRDGTGMHGTAIKQPMSGKDSI